MGSTATLTNVSTLAGLALGAFFAPLRVPIPAPPERPDVMAIDGIPAYFVIVGFADIGFGVLEAVGSLPRIALPRR